MHMNSKGRMCVVIVVVWLRYVVIRLGIVIIIEI